MREFGVERKGGRLKGMPMAYGAKPINRGYQEWRRGVGVKRGWQGMNTRSLTDCRDSLTN